MTREHTVLYLAARGLSAGLNLAAVAVFTRLAGATTYGEYLLVFSWALIIYAVSAQWTRFAFFASYREETAGEAVTAYAWLNGGALGVIGLACAGAAALGAAPAHLVAAGFALALGTSLHEAAVEISRTRLEARVASLCMVLRAALMLLFGTAALLAEGSAAGLVFAVALAHVLASAPAYRIVALIGSRLPVAAALGLLRFGWPLILSFAFLALGNTVDRLLIAAFHGPGALGPYGAALDFLKQSLAIVGEAIGLALMTIAKRDHDAGRHALSAEILKLAYRSLLFLLVFGAAFLWVFADILLPLFLAPDFYEATRHLVPMFLVGSVAMVLKHVYFAQTIYFANNSALELVGSVLFAATAGALCLVLVPAQGTAGAAQAQMIAQLVSCAVFIAAGRRVFRLPIDLAATVWITLAAALLIGAAVLIEGAIASPPVAMAAQATLFAVMSLALVRHLGLARAVASPQAA